MSFSMTWLRRRRNRRRTLFSTGYWRLPGFTKNSLGHYDALIPETCRMIAGARLHLLHDNDEVLRAFKRACADHGVNLTAELRPIAELPARRHADSLLAACKAMALDGSARPEDFQREKGVIHYWRDYVDSGEEVYKDVISIWMSKIGLMAELAASDRAAGAETVAWVDASVARFRGQRSNWDFMKVSAPAGRIAHYGNRMRLRGRVLPVNASVLMGDRAAWREVVAEFDAELRAAFDDAYAHDEETVLGLVHRRRPELFYRIGVPDPPSEFAQEAKGANQRPFSSDNSRSGLAP